MSPNRCFFYASHTDTQTCKHTETHILPDTHTDTQTLRHTDRQTHAQTHAQTHDAQTHTHTHTQTHVHRTQTHSHTATQPHRHTHRHTYTDTQTYVDRHTDTHTQNWYTDTQIHRHTDIRWVYVCGSAVWGGGVCVWGGGGYVSTPIRKKIRFHNFSRIISDAYFSGLRKLLKRMQLVGVVLWVVVPKNNAHGCNICLRQSYGSSNPRLSDHVRCLWKALDLCYKSSVET
jgi:hypothetical protein